MKTCAYAVMFCNHAQEDDLDQFLCRASQHLHRMEIPKLFMTAMVGRNNGNRLAVSGAGLPPAIVYHQAPRSIHRVELKGIPLGTFVDGAYVAQTLGLYPGDSITFMTDGFSELFNASRQMLGQEQAPLKRLFARWMMRSQIGREATRRTTILPYLLLRDVTNG